MKKPLIIIGGPTACGKTAMSILLARKSAARSFLLIPCRFIDIWILVQQK